MNDQLTPTTIYEMVAEVGFKKYFHLGGVEATKDLIDLCPINEHSYVLDVGCASGKTACYIARRFGCRVVGVDILPGMVERATERARAEGVADQVEFKVGDAQDLPLDDNLFDVVLSEFVVGLVNDKLGAVREYARVVKPGGTIGLNEATWLKTPPPPELLEFLSNTVGFKEDLFVADEWAALLESCGLHGLTVSVSKADSMSDPRESLKDLARSLPRVVYSLFRRPRFREFIRMSASIPPNLLDYFGYGFYVGQV